MVWEIWLLKNWISSRSITAIKKYIYLKLQHCYSSFVVVPLQNHFSEYVHFSLNLANVYKQSLVGYVTLYQYLQLSVTLFDICCNFYGFYFSYSYTYDNCVMPKEDRSHITLVTFWLLIETPSLHPSPTCQQLCNVWVTPYKRW